MKDAGHQATAPSKVDQVHVGTGDVVARQAGETDKFACGIDRIEKPLGLPFMHHGRIMEFVGVEPHAGEGTRQRLQPAVAEMPLAARETRRQRQQSQHRPFDACRVDKRLPQGHVATALAVNDRARCGRIMHSATETRPRSPAFRHAVRDSRRAGKPHRRPRPAVRRRAARKRTD